MSPPRQKDAIAPARSSDLSNCDREIVQYPGAIQSHGAMLIVEEPRYVIRQASENAEAFLGVACEDLLGQTIQQVFKRSAPQMLDRLGKVALDNSPVHIARESFKNLANGVDIFAHRAGGVLIVEMEMIGSQEDAPTAHLFADVREIVHMLENTKGLQNFFDLAVARVRKFTGYDRVMVYKFALDGSGHVAAEAKRADLEPFLGLHYPASDIPAPAQRLFALSLLRHLPDVDYVPIRLYPEFHPETHAPVDMSAAILRSVSPMYTRYLRNLGAKSTMVIPLIRDGRLWGLISAMHHSGPRQITADTRMACEFLGRMVSLLIGTKEEADGYTQRLHMKTISDQLVERLGREPDIHSSIGTSQKMPNLLSLIPAGGAAVSAIGSVSTVGNAPSDNDIRQLATWLAKAQPQAVFATDRLAEIYPAAAAFKSIASGVLAIRISAREADYLFWFRPEQTEVVNWAGNPEKAVSVTEADGKVRLQPRSSFALWRESISGRSQPWTGDERKAAADFRQAILEVILSRAEHIDKINRELADANIELDNFAYIASHDLKEPLRGVHLLASFLKRGQEEKLDEQGKQQIETILGLTRRMDDLIESLLQYSRTGRLELSLEAVDMDKLLDDAIADCRHRIAASNVEIRRPDEMGKQLCDRIRVLEVLTNLITNAAKYNDKEKRWIEIGVQNRLPRRYYVRDNGIGISDTAQERIFEIFSRVHGNEEFGGGVGAGLTIARRAVERHAGRLWVESSPGIGSTFYFTLGPEANA